MPALDSAAAAPAASRGVMVFAPPEFVGSFEATIFDDDGESRAYAEGGYAEIRLQVAVADAGIDVRATATGGYQLPYHDLQLVLPPGDKRTFVQPGARAPIALPPARGKRPRGQ